jgi:hypothetical protein
VRSDPLQCIRSFQDGRNFLLLEGPHLRPIQPRPVRDCTPKAVREPLHQGVSTSSPRSASPTRRG